MKFTKVYICLLSLFGCIMPEFDGFSSKCLEPDELPNHYLNGIALYEVVGGVKLCRNTVYELPFIVRSDGSHLDCNGATIMVPHSYERASISSFGYESVTIERCYIYNSAGSGISIYGNDAVISNVIVKGSLKNGINFRAENSLIENSVVFNNTKVGIYIDHGANNNIIIRNNIHANGLSGVVMDATYDNEILDNKIWGNKHGISLYRNCGEHGGIPREYESSGNSIHHNEIFWNKSTNFLISKDYDDSHDIRPGTGIAVGLRQGKTLRAQQDWTPSGDPLALCNDDKYERLSWDHPGPNSLSPKIVGGRMYIVHNQSKSNPDRHFDFAPNTDIYNNIIHDNDIGIVVADQETRIVNNSFSKHGFTGVFVGNKYLDHHMKEMGLQYVRSFHGNSFDDALRCITSSINSRLLIHGSNKEFCSRSVFHHYRL